MRKRIFVVLIHCFVWFAFLSVPYIFKPVHHNAGRAPVEFSKERPERPDFDRHDREKEGVIQDILLPPRMANGVLFIAIFYINYFLIIPEYYKKRNYLLPVLSIIFSTILLLAINYLMRPLGFMHGSAVFTVLGPSHNLFMFIIVVVFSFMLSFYEQMRRMEEEKLYTEISFLKAQINPHFLFNTLNSIYSLSLTKSDRTSDAIVKLSSLFRYSVTDTGKDFVPLTKELKYISDYIALQELRITKKVSLKYEVKGSADMYQVAPFALIPFIENAFKYGVNSQENSDIEILIEIKNDSLYLFVKNNKVYVEKDETINSGLGINNTAKRLQYLYPGKHQLQVEEGDDIFTVRLTIDLK